MYYGFHPSDASAGAATGNAAALSAALIIWLWHITLSSTERVISRVPSSNVY